MKLRKQDHTPGNASEGGTPKAFRTEKVVSISREALEETLYPQQPPRERRSHLRDALIPFPTQSTSLSNSGLSTTNSEGLMEPNQDDVQRSSEDTNGDVEQRKTDISQLHAGHHHGEKPVRPSRTERLEKLIQRVEDKLMEGDIRVSVGDWIRLDEMERELTKSAAPRQVRVTWVTPTQADVKKLFGPRKRGPEGGRDAA